MLLLNLNQKQRCDKCFNNFSTFNINDFHTAVNGRYKAKKHQTQKRTGGGPKHSTMTCMSQCSHIDFEFSVHGKHYDK